MRKGLNSGAPAASEADSVLQVLQTQVSWVLGRERLSQVPEEVTWPPPWTSARETSPLCLLQLQLLQHRPHPGGPGRLSGPSRVHEATRSQTLEPGPTFPHHWGSLGAPTTTKTRFS